VKDLLRMRLFEDVHDIKKLDRHIDEFRKALSEDLKEQDLSKLKVHAKEFEDEVHSELDRLIEATKEDLDMYLRTLNRLAAFKAAMKAISKEEPRFKGIVETELKYAEVIHRGMKQKLSTMHKMFSRMRAR
jgi:hypothetical protein